MFTYFDLKVIVSILKIKSKISVSTVGSRLTVNTHGRPMVDRGRKTKTRGGLRFSFLTVWLTAHW